MIRSQIARGMAALALLSCALSAPALAANITVKDGAGATQTMCTAAQSDSSQAYCFTYRNAAGAQEDLSSKALQVTGNGSLATLAGTVAPAGSPTANAQTVQAGALPLPAGAATDATLQAIKSLLGIAPAQVGGKIDTVINSLSVDRGALLTTASTSVTLMPANAARRGLSIGNQSTSNCWFNGLATATADYHSTLLPALTLYESKDSHVGTGAISVICAAANAPVSAREW